MAIANFIQTTRGRKGTPYLDSAIPLAASQYLRNDGGRFMTIDGNGNYALTAATDVKLDAWVDTCYQSDHSGATTSCNSTPFVGSASAGVSVVAGTRNIHTEDDAAWMPSAVTLTQAMTGTICDLVISGSTTTTKQKINPGTATHTHVRILDVDVVNQLALVYAIV